MSQATKRLLPEASRRLLEEMQGIGFGRIERLVIAGGVPVATEDTRRVKNIRIGARNAPQPESKLDDFALKERHLEMFEHFKRIGDGIVLSLEIVNGLPVNITVEERGFAA